MAPDVSSADAAFQFNIMLLERVTKLEDLYLQLERRARTEDRALAKSSFAMIRKDRYWLVRVHLDARLWPTDAKAHRQLCSELFRELDHFCKHPDADGYASIVFCCHNSDPFRLHTLPTEVAYVVLEGIISSDNPCLTQEGVGAAFDQAWTKYMLRCEFEAPNTVEELGDAGAAVAQAIHCVNGYFTEYERTTCQKYDVVPHVPEVVRALQAAGTGKSLSLQHPRMHELFPEVFDAWLRWGD